MKISASIFSFFSGAGFLDLGFEMSGFEIIGVNEIHKPFLEAYKYSRKHLNMSPPLHGYFDGDITHLLDRINRISLANWLNESRRDNKLVGFIGGPPCPDFSIGGKNKGKEGENGKLSAIYVELICQQKPDFFLFENVKGLWRTKRHRAFYEEIKLKLNKAGYTTTERLINSIEHGVAQDRDRIILIGFNKKILCDLNISLNGSKTLREELFPWKKYVKYSKQEAFSYPWPKTNPFKEDSKLFLNNSLPAELTVSHWFGINDVNNHENSGHYFKPRAGIKRFLTVDEGDDSKKSFKRLHRWRYSPTACYGNNEVHLHPYKPRRISVAEALAIQSLPRDFVLPPHLTLSDMFKMVGNGVPYLTAKSLAQSLKDFLRI